MLGSSAAFGSSLKNHHAANDALQAKLRVAIAALHREAAQITPLVAAPDLRTNGTVAAARRAIMRVLVAGMGHFDWRARRHCTKILAGIVCGHSWEADAALPAEVAVAGEDLELDVTIAANDALSSATGSTLRFVLFAPEWKTTSEAVLGVSQSVPSLHVPTSIGFGSGQAAPWGSATAAAAAAPPMAPPRGATGLARVRLSLGPAPRPGLYDWRLVRVAADGTDAPVDAILPVRAGSPETTTRIAQGRVVVFHGSARGELGRQVCVDEAGVVFDPSTGAVSRHGTLHDLAEGELLASMEAQGETCLFVDGAASRDDGWGESADAAAAVRAEARRGRGATATGMLEGDEGGALSPPGVGGTGATPLLAETAAEAATAARTSFGHVSDLLDLTTSAPAPHPASLARLPAARGPPRAVESVLANFGVRSLAARPWANPHAVTDRARVSGIVGGMESLSRLCREASARGVRLVVQCDAAVSASRPHRKYARREAADGSGAGTSALAHCLDRTGLRQPVRGTDGRLNSFADQTLPNFRLLSSWETMLSDLVSLSEQTGVGGAYLIEAQSWPIQPAIDTVEMLRTDPDGERHHGARGVLEGDVVEPFVEGGYWCDSGGSLCRRVSNPMLLFLALGMWEARGDFALFGECHWGREGPMLSSGVIAHSMALPAALARTQQRMVDKTGAISHAPLHGGSETPVAAAHATIVRDLLHLPLGGSTVVVRSLVSHSMPYPALLLGRATWPAVDVLMTSAGSVHLFAGEEEGRAHRINLAGGSVQDTRFLDDEREAGAQRLARRRQLREASAAAAAASLTGEAFFAPGGSQGGGLAASSRSAGSDDGGVFRSGSDSAASNSTHSVSSMSRSASRLFQFEGHAGVGGVMPVRGSAGAADGGRPAAVPGAVSPSPDSEQLAASAAAAGGGALPSGWAAAATVPGAGMSAALPGGIMGGSLAFAGGMSSSPSTPALASMGLALGFGSAYDNDQQIGSDSADLMAQLGLATEDGATDGTGLDTLLGFSGNDDSTLPATTLPGTAAEDGAERDVGTAAATAAGHSGGWGGPEMITRSSTAEAMGASAAKAATAAINADADDDAAAASVAALAGGRRLVSDADVDASWGAALAGPVLSAFPTDEVRVWRAAPSEADAKGRGGAPGGSSLSLASLSAQGADARLAESDAATLASLGGPEAVPGLSEQLASLAWREASFRESVGPSAGFDLACIGGHYRHRRLLRAALPVLRTGACVPLVARHRFGPHGHCLSYGRVGDGSIAVVGVNFNAHPSTFSIDCTPLASAFGATAVSLSKAAAAAAAAAAPQASARRAPAEHTITDATLDDVWATNDATTDLFGVLDPASAPVAPAEPSEPYPLVGGVWEVRDAFSLPSPTEEDAAALLARPAGPAGAESNAIAMSWLCQAPLVAMLTSDEAAAAPITTTVRPTSSLCWVFSRRGAASGTAKSGQPVATAADARWALASSLLRLQSTLRVKECGVGTAVDAPAGSPLSALAAAEEEALLGSATSAIDETERATRPRWIPPWSMLSDAEVRSTARHNTVYALLEAATLRGASHCRAAERSPGACPAAISAAADTAARLMRSALRVLVAHWGIRVKSTGSAGSADVGSSAREREANLFGASFRTPPLASAAAASLRARAGPGEARALLPPDDLEADPLPALAAAGATTLAGAPHGGRVVASVAAVVCRAAIWHACAAVDGGWTGESVGPRDGGAAAAAMAALSRVATGGAGCAVGSGPAGLETLDAAVTAFARMIVFGSSLSSVAFATPELGNWSTVGGLGVMVDELTIGVARLGVPVTVISPFYDRDKKGRPDYLRKDRILFTGRVVTVHVGGGGVSLGLHAGFVNGVRLFFLHNASVFPRPYPSLDAEGQIRQLAIFGKAFLQTLCDVAEAEAKGEPLFLPGHGPGAVSCPRGASGEDVSDDEFLGRLKSVSGHARPSVVVTNDWFTGLVPAYARCGHFGRWFDGTDFLHICHNLDPSYEGRMYPGPKGTLEHIHGLPVDRLVDPTWAGVVVNPTRCALLTSDTWATVSRSYRQDLLSSSPLNHILCSSPHPFAHPNGIDIGRRASLLDSLQPEFGIGSHAQAKEYLQSKYFGAGPDATRPLFGFVGRVTAQKGVHLILSSVEPIIHATGGRAQFIVGGMASLSDTYGQGCASEMYRLHRAYPGNFWADPTAFFTDGVAVNLGCDFCLMPSMFEPGGIVQHEFFVAGTPVIAFKTGGLKDSVIEYRPRSAGGAADRRGNGFTFERYDLGDFLASMQRALGVFDSPSDYDQCRANAIRSVMPLSTVSAAWFGEFCRLRRALPVPNPTPEAADQEARQAASDSLRDAGINPFASSIRVNAAGFEVDGVRSVLTAEPAPTAATPAVAAAALPPPLPPSPVTPGPSGRADLQVLISAGGSSSGSAGGVDLVPVLFMTRAPGVAGSEVCPEVGATVSVCGSWDGWSNRTLLVAGGVATPGKIAAVVGLKPGDYQYKYVVSVPKSGDHWRSDPSSAITNDAGTVNNRLSVVISERVVTKTEEEAVAEIERALLGGVGPRMQMLLSDC